MAIAPGSLAPDGRGGRMGRGRNYRGSCSSVTRLRPRCGPTTATPHPSTSKGKRGRSSGAARQPGPTRRRRRA